MRSRPGQMPPLFASFVFFAVLEMLTSSILDLICSVAGSGTYATSSTEKTLAKNRFSSSAISFSPVINFFSFVISGPIVVLLFVLDLTYLENFLLFLSTSFTMSFSILLLALRILFAVSFSNFLYSSLSLSDAECLNTFHFLRFCLTSRRISLVIHGFRNFVLGWLIGTCFTIISCNLDENRPHASSTVELD